MIKDNCLKINQVQTICSKDEPILSYNDNDYGFRDQWGIRYEDVVKKWFFRED